MQSDACLFQVLPGADHVLRYRTSCFGNAARHLPVYRQQGDHAKVCMSHSFLYTPFIATSSLWLPRSMMRPRSSTMISSAVTIVESRWAITMLVRFRIRLAS